MSGVAAVQQECMSRVAAVQQECMSGVAAVQQECRSVESAPSGAAGLEESGISAQRCSTYAHTPICTYTYMHIHLYSHTPICTYTYMHIHLGSAVMQKLNSKGGTRIAIAVTIIFKHIYK